MSTAPADLAIPAPRGAAEPTRGRRSPDDQLPAALDQPGWLSLIEALDGFAGSLVARYEHELTRAAADELPRLRRQVEQARRLEATIAAAATAARRSPSPLAPGSAPHAARARG